MNSQSTFSRRCRSWLDHRCIAASASVVNPHGYGYFKPIDSDWTKCVTLNSSSKYKFTIIALIFMATRSRCGSNRGRFPVLPSNKVTRRSRIRAMVALFLDDVQTLVQSRPYPSHTIIILFGRPTKEYNSFRSHNRSF